MNNKVNYSEVVQNKAKILKEVSPDKTFEWLCEYVTKSPNKPVEQLVDELFNQ